MKGIIILILLSYVHNFISSQNIDSLIAIKGYSITVIQKQDVQFSFEQQILKSEGKSFNIPIDYTRNSFFIPVQVGNKNICKNNQLADKLLMNVQNDSIYIIPNSHNIGTLTKIHIVQENIHKVIFVLSNAMRLSPYYEICGNNNILFRCTYIEGYARCKNIKDIEPDWLNYLLNICYIERKVSNSTFFFIVKINYYTPYIDVPKIKKWLPFSN